MRKPSPAMIVALLALFVALGGVGVAATGGNFLLGQPNTASSQTALTAGINSKAMAITNTNTGASAGALALNVAAGKPPLVASAGAGKATNLNADKVDGVDADQFTRRLWAAVRGDGTLVRGAGATAAMRLNEGLYSMEFNRDVTNCAYVATIGDPTPGAAGLSGVISTSRAAGALVDTVLVSTLSVAGFFADHSFFLVASC
jgi:hypothetical protein